MKVKLLRHFIFYFSVFIFACNSKDTSKKKNNLTKEKSTQNIKYATGFSISYFSDYKVLNVKKGWKGSKVSFKYVLYNKTKPKNITHAVFIKTPIKSIACMSLTHLAFLEKLGLQNCIVAISGCNYVSSKKILARIKKGFIQEVGHDNAINYELLIDNKPDILMTFGIDQSNNQQLNKFKELGINTILNAEYLETTPLGRAEWIKFVAALFNKDKEAAKIFNEIENEYLSLKDKVQHIKKKPTVFTGMPWNGSWYIPGGKSYQAQLFKDAGANYLWAANKEEASLIVSKEVIIEKAYNADFWLNLNSYKSINQVVNFDGKFKNFKAVVKNNMFNNNKRLNQNNGNDYWESGVVNPQLILNDLIQIFHPEIIKRDKLFYYKRLDK